MRLLTPCPICNRPLELKSEVTISDTESLFSYKCGHSFIEQRQAKQLEQKLELKSLNGSKSAYEYQNEGVEFILKSDFNCLIADPMGLGKTIQALLAAREARDRFKRIMILVKSSTSYQWLTESKEWYSSDLWSTWIIRGSKNFIPPGFNLYIMSMDTLSRFMKSDAGSKALKDLKMDLVIVDECHSFKNPDSSRSQALVAFLQGISHTEIERVVNLNCVMCRHSWKETTKVTINLRDRTTTTSHYHTTVCPACKARTSSRTEKSVLDENERQIGLVMLSGTPIKNRADEYFVSLNQLKPSHFTSLKQFQRQWLIQDSNGKYTRIAPWKLDAFRELTKDFILRREKRDVLDFIPPFRRTFETIYCDDKILKNLYNKELDNLEELTEGKKFSFWDISDCLMTLRRIAGQMKIPFATEYVDTFLDTTENEKIAIGVHHKAVRDGLYYNLSQRGFNPIKISGEDSPEEKERKKNLWVTDESKKVLIVQILAGGVGLNLQTKTCCTMLGLEREWNAADEEQFEGRFYGRANKETNPPNFHAEYMEAEGTCDTIFREMVEKKRRDCAETLGDNINVTEGDDLKTLVRQTIESRLK